MKIAVFGTGMVARSIGTKLIQLGHDVKMGARDLASDKAADWVHDNGQKAHHGTYAEAAEFGQLVFNCTAGAASLSVMQKAGPENLKNKILIDVANPLDFTVKPIPTLAIANTTSLGEQLQRFLPATLVVKTLNTVNYQVMVNPSLIPGDHDVFVSGNDAAAKAQVTNILRDWFGWKSVIDLGDITTARGPEMMMPLWLRLWSLYGTADFNFKIVKN